VCLSWGRDRLGVLSLAWAGGLFAWREETEWGWGPARDQAQVAQQGNPQGDAVLSTYTTRDIFKWIDDIRDR
jgi:3-oxoacyl-ACP reductase-like protein